MDWIQVLVTFISVMVPTGGIVTIVTLRDKKYEAFLGNVSKLNEQWKSIADERAARNAELKADLEKKDKKIDTLYTTLDKCRIELDHTRTHAAVLEVTHCHRIACGDREPPLGSEECKKCGESSQTKISKK